jgi:hypothetical protein
MKLITDISELKIIEPKYIEPIVDEKTGKKRFICCIDEKCFEVHPEIGLINPYLTNHNVDESGKITYSIKYVCRYCKKEWDEYGNILKSDNTTTESESTTTE